MIPNLSMLSEFDYANGFIPAERLVVGRRISTDAYPAH
jgi:hypothetical protein